MAERLKQMAAIVEGQRRALEKIHAAEADTFKEGGAVLSPCPGKEFLRSCIHAMWRTKATACCYDSKQRTATKIQAAARRLLARRQLMAVRACRAMLRTSTMRPIQVQQLRPTQTPQTH